MKRDSENIDDIVRKHLPSASPEHMEQDIDHLFRELHATPAPTFNPVRPVRRFQWPAIAAIAAAIAIAVLVPTRVLQSAPAVLEDANGSRKIQYGEIVRSGDDMNAMLSMSSGARVEVRSMSELSLERTDDGTRIRLNNGGVIVDAAGQHENLYVQTKDVMASVGGAVSLVKSEEEGSSVAAIGGEIRVQQGTTETKLRPGEQVASNPKMELLPVKEQVTWSREALAHAAMLRQAMPPTPPPPPTSPQTQREERLAFEVATIRPAAPRPEATGPNARGGGGAASDQSCIAGPAHIQLDPRRLNIRNTSLHELVAIAYGTCSEIRGRLSGGPDWVKADKWDIEALIPEGSVDPLPTTAYGGPSMELMEDRSPKVQKMIRTLVEERFKVVVKREMKETPVYVLTVAPGGPKFQGNDFPYGAMLIGPGMMQAGGGREARQALLRGGGAMSAAQGAQTASSRTAPCLKNPGLYGNPDGPGSAGTCQHFTFLNQFMDRVAGAMAANFFAGRIVVNRTGIQEKVSFVIEWEVGVPGQIPQPRSLPELSKSLEPVGLQLKEDPKGLVEFLVIERAEKPTEN